MLAILMSTSLQGSMSAPLFNTRSFKISYVAKGEGSAEIVCPHHHQSQQGSESERGKGRRRREEEEGSEEEEEEAGLLDKLMQIM